MFIIYVCIHLHYYGDMHPSKRLAFALAITLSLSDIVPRQTMTLDLSVHFIQNSISHLNNSQLFSYAYFMN